MCNIERIVHTLADCTGCSTAPHIASLYHVTTECTGCSTAPHTTFSAVPLPTPGEQLPYIFQRHPQVMSLEVFHFTSDFSLSPSHIRHSVRFQSSAHSDWRSGTSRANGRYRPLSDATCSCCSVSTVVQTQTVHSTHTHVRLNCSGLVKEIMHHTVAVSVTSTYSIHRNKLHNLAPSEAISFNP